jgi:hypothetical protein
MDITFEVTNTAVGVTWGIVIFLLGGMIISRRRGR